MEARSLHRRRGEPRRRDRHRHRRPLDQILPLHPTPREELPSGPSRSRLRRRGTTGSGRPAQSTRPPGPRHDRCTPEAGRNPRAKKNIPKATATTTKAASSTAMVASRWLTSSSGSAGPAEGGPFWRRWFGSFMFSLVPHHKSQRCQRGDQEDGDLSQRVEAPEIHEDHVDDVPAAPRRQALARNGLLRRLFVARVVAVFPRQQPHRPVIDAGIRPPPLIIPKERERVARLAGPPALIPVPERQRALQGREGPLRARRGADRRRKPRRSSPTSTTAL